MRRGILSLVVLLGAASVSAAKPITINGELDGKPFSGTVERIKLPDGSYVVEAKLDKGRGPVATVLVQRGTLQRGDAVVIGEAYGKIRAMTDYQGKQVKKAGPSDAIEIIGLESVPDAGDILSAVGARERVRTGIFDLLATGGDPNSLTTRTAVERLSLVPALGREGELPESLGSSPPDRSVWADVFHRLSANADIVVVDTAAGMFGANAPVLGACSHVLGVLQAETMSQRSFDMFDRALAAMDRAPTILGVVLNMLRRSHKASLAVLADASAGMPEERLRTYVESARRQAEDGMGRALEPFAGAVNPARVHLVRGIPHVELVDLVARRGDLAVIGTAPPSGGGAFLIREEAEETIHRLVTSIVAVKPDGFVSPVA